MGFQLVLYVAALWLDWQKLAIFCGLVPILLLPLMVIVPESHVWLVANGREEDAKKSIQWFYGNDYDVEDDFQETVDHHTETKKAMSSWRDVFR
jgi:hypothetical protein